jgi:hypothetical protein
MKQVGFKTSQKAQRQTSHSAEKSQTTLIRGTGKTTGVVTKRMGLERVSQWLDYLTVCYVGAGW